MSSITSAPNNTLVPTAKSLRALVPSRWSAAPRMERQYVSALQNQLGVLGPANKWVTKDAADRASHPKRSTPAAGFAG